MAESEGPVRIRAFEFIQDSGGAGQYRGGMSFRRDYEMKEREGTLQIRNDRCTFQPFALFGGKPGRLGRNVLNPGTAREETMPGKLTRTIRESDVFRYEQAGGGGWGDPLKRDPVRVLADVRNEYVTAEMARLEYGVVINTQTWAVDKRKTHELRERMRVGRKTLVWVDRGMLPARLLVEESIY
jgi:N-methylhydantoinase B